MNGGMKQDESSDHPTTQPFNNPTIQPSILPTLRAWLQLMRLPAVFTAIGNIATGFFAVSQPPYDWERLIFLCLASCCFLISGMIFNDYCDRERDRIERPSRPLPSGKILPLDALSIGTLILFLGIGNAAIIGSSALIPANFLILAIIGYVTTRRSILMASCRFLNVTLGATPRGSIANLITIPPGFFVFPSAIALWTLAIMYFSKREVEKPHYQKIVKKMILGFIVLDAIFVTFLAGWPYGLAVLSLLVPSVLLARWIYVT